MNPETSGCSLRRSAIASIPSSWTAGRIPDQTGRLAIVTGANAGLGLETARVLGRAGARVVLACRSEDRGVDARDRLREAIPGARFEFRHLDLASLSSVRAFAAGVRSSSDRVDLLINNAGVMFPPFGVTAEGFELQFGVNYLGHYVLTGLLLGLLRAAPGARVVTLSSVAHRGSRIDFENLTEGSPYRRIQAYRQSKLACLMFALELQKRLSEAGDDVRSLAAHPGATRTDLQRHNRAVSLGARLIGMDPGRGALSQLCAATEPDLAGGEYVGPTGPFECWGAPGAAKIDPAAREFAVRNRLWAVSEELTGVRYPS